MLRKQRSKVSHEDMSHMTGAQADMALSLHQQAGRQADRGAAFWVPTLVLSSPFLTFGRQFFSTWPLFLTQDLCYLTAGRCSFGFERMMFTMHVPPFRDTFLGRSRQLLRALNECEQRGLRSPVPPSLVDRFLEAVRGTEPSDHTLWGRIARSAWWTLERMLLGTAL